MKLEGIVDIEGIDCVGVGCGDGYIGGCVIICAGICCDFAAIIVGSSSDATADHLISTAVNTKTAACTGLSLM